jgi:hypothetical protein
MVKAIFYDRKNKREVKNTELMFINAVQDIIMYGNQTRPYELQIGELGYKSKNCNPFEEWDLFCMHNDLIFLRFES